MTHEDFEKIFDETVERLKVLSGKKGAEYANHQDRLYNFKAAAVLNRTTPLLALKGMMAKHEVSIMDMITANDIVPEGQIVEKIDDNIMYLILLKAMLFERNQVLEKSKALMEQAPKKKTPEPEPEQ